MNFTNSGISDNDLRYLWLSIKRGSPDECWPWLRDTNHNGYGKLWAGGRSWPAHRLVLWSEYGPPPTDRPYALHSCDNPQCCNPGHLRWGTHAENMRDRSVRNLSYIKQVPAIAKRAFVERKRVHEDIELPPDAFADNIKAFAK